MPSFTLIHPTVWPQYTNVTDMTDRQDRTQRSDSVGRTVLQTVVQKTTKIKPRVTRAKRVTPHKQTVSESTNGQIQIR